MGWANEDLLDQYYLGTDEECRFLGLTQAAGVQESGILTSSQNYCSSSLDSGMTSCASQIHRLGAKPILIPRVLEPLARRTCERSPRHGWPRPRRPAAGCARAFSQERWGQPGGRGNRAGGSPLSEASGARLQPSLRPSLYEPCLPPQRPEEGDSQPSHRARQEGG